MNCPMKTYLNSRQSHLLSINANKAPLQANVNATAPTSLSMPIPHIRHQSETAPLSSTLSRPKLYRQNVLSGTSHIRMHILRQLNRFIGTEQQHPDIQCPTTLPTNTKVNVTRHHHPTMLYNTKTLIHNPPKKRSHQGSAYPNIKHYRTIASLMHSTIYRTSSSVT